MIAINNVLPLLVLSFVAAQTINGVKPVDDGTRKYAVAFVKQASEIPAVAQKPDPFMAGYFSYRAKVMASLIHTKYTAAYMGICGTVLGLYDEGASKAIKAASDRITKGSKDFDSLTADEVESINKELARWNPSIENLTGFGGEGAGPFLAGARLGMLAARVTVWHISPKQKILLTDITDAIKGCSETGEKGQGGNPDVAQALRGFASFKEKEMDEATVRSVGKQIESVLRASLPEKYRWPE